jgi:hypothetical protein
MILTSYETNPPSQTLTIYTRALGLVKQRLWRLPTAGARAKYEPHICGTVSHLICSNERQAALHTKLLGNSVEPRSQIVRVSVRTVVHSLGRFLNEQIPEGYIVNLVPNRRL